MFVLFIYKFLNFSFHLNYGRMAQLGPRLTVIHSGHSKRRKRRREAIFSEFGLGVLVTPFAREVRILLLQFLNLFPLSFGPFGLLSDGCRYGYLLGEIDRCSKS